MNSTDRLPALDGLRAISILLVLAAHMLPLGPKVLQLNSSAAAMGMSLFFCLSGFLIASGLIHNPDVPEFLVKRLARIVPLAYAYTLLTAGFLYFDPETVLWMATFLLNFRDHTESYNAHFWSLCVEVQFYVAVAIAVAIVGRKGIWIVWPACFAITILRINMGEGGDLRMDEILVGACVATLYRKTWAHRALFPTLLVVVAALLWFASSSPFSGWFNSLRSYATALLLAAVLSNGSNRLVKFLSLRPMRYIATISYALYVIHPLTVQGWWNEGSVFDRYLFKRPISFLMAFAAAHISTFYWERPWQLAARRWIEERRRRLRSAI